MNRMTDAPARPFPWEQHYPPRVSWDIAPDPRPVPAMLRDSVAAFGPLTAIDWRGRAIRGTDPVAYFTEGRAVPGDPDIAHEWSGATWRFASEENRARFIADPAAYAPQFGGYCSWAVSKGYTASTDPEAWTIVDGKLYLNYSKDVQKQWLADRDAAIARAEANWPGVLD